VWVNDASMLPDAPGVNPQGSVQAFAVRNARRFIETNSPRG
jgi:choline dehydrogenase-like flavoprotein